jgi:hypothetical protein
MNSSHEKRNDNFVLARSFAIRHGFSVEQIIRYCETGKIQGACFDRILWQWVLYPPVRLLIR